MTPYYSRCKDEIINMNPASFYAQWQIPFPIIAFHRVYISWKSYDLQHSVFGGQRGQSPPNFTREKSWSEPDHRTYTQHRPTTTCTPTILTEAQAWRRVAFLSSRKKYYGTHPRYHNFMFPWGKCLAPAQQISAYLLCCKLLSDKALECGYRLNNIVERMWLCGWIILWRELPLWEHTLGYKLRPFSQVPDSVPNCGEMR